LRTLRAAGRVADGVFIRVGTAEANLRAAVEAVRAGAVEAGREPRNVALGAVFHTVLDEDAERALLIGKSMAAGYYEYSPQLFGPAGLSWEGPPVEELKQVVRPDFHHTRDHPGAGRLVDFLPERAADAFCLRGSADEIARQLGAVLGLGLDLEIVVLQPIPDPPPPDQAIGSAYMETMAREVLPLVRAVVA
jgi:5,10-methylenetetrahydromethanopterin reductase